MSNTANRAINDQYSDTLIKKYLEKTEISAELAQKARKFIPGGDSHGPSYHPPYHLTYTHGEGSYIYDVDGNRYLDYCNQWLTMPHGHAFPPMVEVLRKRIGESVGFGFPTEKQYQFAELLCNRVPSYEQMRFVASGSEATLMCIRAARAYTGKKKIMKPDGGYHGTHDLGEYNWFPSCNADSLDNIQTTSPDAGVSGSDSQDVIVFPYNEPEIFTRIIEQQAREVAAVIMEPMIGPLGMIEPVPGFLETIRSLTEKHGVILIFDEVVQFPTAFHGAQDLFKVTPDLTALGKAIGGGYPIGAWGGRRDIMDLWNPEKMGHDVILQVSSHAGNAVSIEAGLATLSHLTESAISSRNIIFHELQQGLNKVFADKQIRGQVTGTGYGFAIHLTDRKILNPGDSFSTAMAYEEISGLIFMGLRFYGIAVYPPLFGIVTTQMREEEVKITTEAMEKTLADIMPVIEAEYPQLLIQGK